MPRFISLSNFKSLYTDQSQLLTEEGSSAFMQRLQSPEGETIAAEKGINHFDFIRFAESLANPQLILFHSWVEQNPELLSFLEGKKIEHPFDDKKHHLKHRWGDEYRKFVSPYVVERLLKEATDELSNLVKLFSFTDLIVTDDRATVEAQLFKPIRQRLERVKHSEVIDNEQSLIDLIQPLCSDEIIVSLNLMSKGSYGLKLEYVDAILSAIRAKGCTVRFANWIIKKMEEVQLNEEHKLKLYKLRKELKEGTLQVRNHGKGRTPIRWKNLIALTFIISLVAFIFFIIYYKPYNKVEEPEFENNASFKKFTVEDRKAIDSLLKVMNDEDFTERFEVDPGVLSAGGNAITLRREYKNKLMERIYGDLTKDASLKEYYATDSCGSKLQFKRYSGVKNLLKKSGSIETIVRNESDYDVIIYVTTTMKEGDVYSVLLKRQETVEFKMNAYEILTTVAGNIFRKYEVPNGATEGEVPSLSFQRHFCDTDANYEESINSPLQLVHSAKRKAKFMIMGDLNGYYRVIDVYSVMEDY